MALIDMDFALGGGGGMTLDMSALKCIQIFTGATTVFNNVTLIPDHNYLIMGHYQTLGDYTVGQAYDFSTGLSSTYSENIMGIFKVDSSNNVTYVFRSISTATISYNGTNVTCSGSGWLNTGNTKFGLFDLNQDN